jgi:hypothetical protein
MKKYVIACVVAAACGGSKGKVSEPQPPPPGDTHATPPPAPAAPDAAPATSEETRPPAATEAPAIRPPQPPVSGVEIELKNSGETDVTFGVTKGWAPVIFAYTGKPPKAKSVILFDNPCSASCDTPEEGICPSCPEPKNKKEEQKMAKIETAPAGGSVKVHWDGKVLTYDKAPGKKKCKCWKKSDPQADSYTIKACGIRRAKETGKASKPVCTETVVTLGPGETSPKNITLDFAK